MARAFLKCAISGRARYGIARFDRASASVSQASAHDCADRG
jgi:hypothetical protein